MSKDLNLDISAEAPKAGAPATIDEQISFYKTEGRVLRAFQGIFGAGFLFFGIQAASEAMSDTPTGRIIGHIAAAAVNSMMFGYFHSISSVDELVEANLTAHKIIQESTQPLPNFDVPPATEQIAQAMTSQLLPPPVSQ